MGLIHESYHLKNQFLIGATSVHFELYSEIKVFSNSSNVLNITKQYTHQRCFRDCMHNMDKGCVAALFKGSDCTLLNQRRSGLKFVEDSGYTFYDLWPEDQNSVSLNVVPQLRASRLLFFHILQHL